LAAAFIEQARSVFAERDRVHAPAAAGSGAVAKIDFDTG